MSAHSVPRRRRGVIAGARSVLLAARKLVLGETWALPIGVACAVGVAVVVRAAWGSGGWWHSGGGALLGVMLAVALAASVVRGAR